MGKHRDSQFKEYVSKLIVEDHRMVTEVAHELEISSSTIKGWVSDYRKKKKKGSNQETYLTPSEVETLQKQHEKELNKLREENEILKKAMHIFTKDPS
jgi:transposase